MYGTINVSGSIKRYSWFANGDRQLNWRDRSYTLSVNGFTVRRAAAGETASERIKIMGAPAGVIIRL